VRGRCGHSRAASGLVALRLHFVSRYRDFVFDSRVECKLFCVGMHFSLDNYVCSTYIRRMKRVSLFLSEPQIAALKKLSKRAGIKASELIRRFIDEGLKRA
jgi:hypothetical protein